ncbi:MAG TPA: CvpA family protein [Candidatus Eisenbacteria bacterium]|nr:CvpA family protein [Candidatus Eisenbacteria bacterium]
MNWVDFVIVGVLLFYAVEGYALGAFPAFFDLLQFSASFLLGLQFYGLFTPFLTRQFSLPSGLSNAISFFLIAFIAEFLLHIFFRFLLKTAFKDSFLLKPELKRLNRILGIFPGLLSGMVLMMFILTVVASLPLSPFLRQTITNARLGRILLARSQLFEKQVSTIFGNAAHDTMNFLTVEPESNSSVALHFTYANGKPDEQAELQMLQMVNTEREKVGLSDVHMNDLLQKVARAHAQDMLQRGYFSHYSPEGLNPFDRMDKAGVVYASAGENLAFSPTVDLAMQGLMNSPGHKANILSKDFGKVGIGVIDAGVYGEMFVQEFTN